MPLVSKKDEDGLEVRISQAMPFVGIHTCELSVFFRIELIKFKAKLSNLSYSWFAPGCTDAEYSEDIAANEKISFPQ